MSGGLNRVNFETKTSVTIRALSLVGKVSHHLLKRFITTNRCLFPLNVSGKGPM